MFEDKDPIAVTSSFRLPDSAISIDMTEQPNLPSIWNGKKNASQKKLDDVVTLEFIDYVKSYWQKLNDTITTKKDVWKTIADKMSLRYHLGMDPTD